MIELGNVERYVYEKCVEEWGSAAQILQAVEEMAELTAELVKMVNRPTEGDQERVIDEVADVAIMVEQLALMVGVHNVNERMNYKFLRLHKKLKSDFS